MTTRLINNREAALQIGFDATDWHIPMDYDAYLSITADWDVQAIVRDDKIIGAAYSKNGETHVSILPEWRKRWLTKGLLKKITADMTHTRVTPGHEFMYNILNRLGFILQPDGILTRES
jgi:hypothetical protein